MRYSTVLKFIAFTLCAATLLGMVASAAGIFFLTELGDKSVEEAYTDTLHNQAVGYANTLGEIYVSQDLGGASRQMLSYRYGNDWENWYFNWARVGYTLRDGEGTVLQEQEIPDGRSVWREYELPVSGQYMQVIATVPKEEYASQTPDTPAESAVQVQVMPAQEKTTIGAVYALYTDGHQEEWAPGGNEMVGILCYTGGDTVTFQSNIGELPMGDGWYPNYIMFADMGGNVVYEASDDTMVLLGSGLENGLTEWYLPAAAVTTAAPVGITYTDGDYTSYDAIPEQGVTVASMKVNYGTKDDGEVGGEGVASPDLIGTVFHDYQGNAQFHSSSPLRLDIPEDAIITYISFTDAQENLIFEARCPQGVGKLENDENRYLIFKGAMPGTEIAEESVPEETVPPVTEELSDPGEYTAVLLKDAKLYNIPSLKGTELIERKAGFEITILRQGIYNEKLWGLTQEGWILLEEGLLQTQELPAGPAAPEAEEGEYTAVLRKDVKLYDIPSLKGAELIERKAGSEITVLRQNPVDEELWGLTQEGWILLEEGVLETQAPPAGRAVPEGEETLAKEGEEPAEDALPVAASETIPEETAVSATEAAEAALAEKVPELQTEETVWPQENIETIPHYDREQGREMVTQFVMVPIPEGYTMTIRLARGALKTELGWTLLRLAEAFRSILLEALGICILVFALCVVHLCCSAGRTRRSAEVRAGGLNRIPLDLRLGMDVVLGMGLGALALEGSRYFARNDEQLAIILLGACSYLLCLVIVGAFFAFVAQIKTPDGFWWRNSLCGRCLALLVKAWKWGKSAVIRGWTGGKPVTIRLLKGLGGLAVGLWLFTRKTAAWLWDTGKRLSRWLWDIVVRSWRWSIRNMVRFFGMLPITWQFLVTGFVLVFLLYVCLRSYKVGWILVGFGVFFAAILYAASAFAILLESARRMSKGDLDTKVDDRMLIGGFRDFSEQLNNLADVAVVAAQKQLKSERMKTELITNVSHDIKTPLTSIINYVDLLQKPHTPQEQEVFLEVLSRQSLRLKKLIDDLMEMSKASTGNIAVEITRMDAAEAVNQALGEFADKLERAELTPVFRQPEETVEMMADGRLVWRVMSNLLGNTVKYALPGTRVYLDLLQMDGKVIISMKNISREELNVNADELLERFVRGDASRNTEGSGLGLNIAQSLMELQKGQLQILVDGDLFKVTLIFPGV